MGRVHRGKAEPYQFVACVMLVFTLSLRARGEPAQTPPHRPLDGLVGTLQRALGDEQAYIRVKAACALIDLCWIDEKVIETLIQGLSAEEPGVVSSSLRGIAQLGPRAESAVPALMRLLQSRQQVDAEALTRAVMAVGRPLIPDLQKLLTHADPVVRRRAVQLVGEMGYAAHPVASQLADMLGEQDPLLRAAVIEAVGRIGRAIRKADAEAARALQYVDLQNTEERRQIYAQISADGAEALVDILLGERKPPECAIDNAYVALAYIGAPAIPACLRLWQSGGEHASCGTKALAGMGPLAAPAVEPLLASAKQFTREDVEQCICGDFGRDPKVLRFWNLTVVLMQIGAYDADAVRRALGSEQVAVRILAVSAFDKRCLAAGDELVGLLEDQDVLVRQAALGGLAKLGEHAVPALPRLQKMLTDDDPKTRELAAVVIGGLGEAGRSAVSDLVGRLHDDREQVRSVAAQSLARMGPPGVEALRSLIGSDRAIDRLRALEAVVSCRQSRHLDHAEVGQRVDSVVLADVARSLHEPRGAIAAAAVRARRAMLEDAQKHREFEREAEIVKLVGEPVIGLTPGDDVQTRAESIRFLAVCWEKLPGSGNQIERGLAAIAAGCRDENPAIRRAALLALATMKLFPNGVLDRLVAGLDDEHPDVRSAAAQALWAFWSGHDPESGEQIQPVSYQHPAPRTALPRQDEAIAKLTAMLADNQTQVRRSAAQALGAFGVDAQSALSALRKFARDSDATVAKAAAEAVDNIEAGVTYSGLIRPLAPPEGHALPSSDIER